PIPKGVFSILSPPFQGASRTIAPRTPRDGRGRHALIQRLRRIGRAMLYFIQLLVKTFGPPGPPILGGEGRSALGAVPRSAPFRLPQDWGAGGAKPTYAQAGLFGSQRLKRGVSPTASARRASTQSSVHTFGSRSSVSGWAL